MLIRSHRSETKVHLSESRPLPWSVPASESIPKICFKRNKWEELFHYCANRSSTLCEDKRRTHRHNKSDITSVQNKNTAGLSGGGKRPLQQLLDDPYQVKQLRRECSVPESWPNSSCQLLPPPPYCAGTHVGRLLYIFHLFCVFVLQYRDTAGKCLV